MVGLDPRVEIAPAALAELIRSAPNCTWEAVGAHHALNEARALATTLDTHPAPKSMPSRESWKRSPRPGCSATCGCCADEEAPARRRRRWKR